MQPKKGKHLNVLDRENHGKIVASVINAILTLVMWVIFTIEDMWREKGSMILMAIVVFISVENAMRFQEGLADAVIAFVTTFPGMAWIVAVMPTVTWIVAAMAVLTVMLYLMTGAMKFLSASIYGFRMTRKHRHLLLIAN